MIQTPVIITFANQKGGVGKTTLCVTFANYLVTKGVNVAIVDCDFQHSIIKCRKADIKKYDVQYVPYDVLSYEANDKKAIIALIDAQRFEPGCRADGFPRQPAGGRTGADVRELRHYRCAIPLRPDDRSLYRQLPDVYRPPAQGCWRKHEGTAFHCPQPS